MSHQDEAVQLFLGRDRREAIMADKLVRWRALAANLKKQSDELAADFDSTYEKTINILIDLFTRMEALDSRGAWLRSIRPSGPLITPELKESIERELQELERASPDLLRLSRLYNAAGRQVWPPPPPPAA
jgi:hypothetical protein